MAQRRRSRRRALQAGLTAAGAVAGAGLLGRSTREADAVVGLVYGAKGARFRVNDDDILNFALNLEYLEAEFYQIAANGSGLTAGDVTGTGNQGSVAGGSQVAFQIPVIQQYVREIAADELDHVRFLRTALGKNAVARPQIDLDTSFTAAATAAGVISAGETFNPFTANTLPDGTTLLADYSFLLGSYIFEDVGVTAYQGGSPYIRNPNTLGAAAKILAVEAQHAAIVRSTMYATATNDPSLASIIEAADQIAVARNTLSQAADGVAGTDQGISQPGTTTGSVTANIVPSNVNGQTFARSFAAVLNIVYLGGYQVLTQTGSGGFLPLGMNGRIH